MNRAIVLRSYLNRSQRLILFDACKGKVIAYARAIDKPVHAPNGALVYYSCSAWRDMLMLEDVQLHAVPYVDDQVETDQKGVLLRFIHQVLEIVEAFMPINVPMPELFSKIYMLYTAQAVSMHATLFRQHLFLCRMLAVLGIYPEEHIYMRSHVVRCLILSPFEFMVEHEDASIHDALELWLKQCLVTHPTVSAWKTLK